MNKQKIPDIDSIAELAKFWDSHDLADFESEMEEVKGQVFARSADTALRIALPASEARHLRRIARAGGVRETTVLRRWIIERLHDSSLSGLTGKLPRKTSRPSRPVARLTSNKSQHR